MRYTLCLMPMHLALHFSAAECGVHATAMGVHPGIQGMPAHFPDTQMHAGMHAGMHTSMYFLVRPDALVRYASCLMPMHCILGGGKWRACGCYGRASRHLEDAYVLACTQACTPIWSHCNLCPVHHNFVEFWMVLSRFRQRARHMHVGVHACTPKLACTLACILYLADLHGRIDSACIHEA